MDDDNLATELLKELKVTSKRIYIPLWLYSNSTCR